MRLLLGDLGEAVGPAGQGQGDAQGVQGHEEDPGGVLGLAGGVAEGGAGGDHHDEDTSKPGDCVVTYCYVQDEGYPRGHQHVVVLGEAGRPCGSGGGGGAGGGGVSSTGRTVRGGAAGLRDSSSQVISHSPSPSFVPPQHPVLTHATAAASAATVVVSPNTTPSSGAVSPSAAPQESSGSSSGGGGGRGKGAVYACRPFACTFCLKRFKRRDHLVEHERTHTGERPYMCAKCGRSFAKKTNLNSHMKSHHRM